MSENENTEVIPGHAEEVGQELALASPTPGTLFRTDDPVQVLERATETANALKSVLQRQNLTTRIQNREHVNVEGWQTLGAMLGVTPVCVWTRPVDKGWEARVEARTLDGRVIGAAEAECLRSESTWKSRDDYAIRSMAQTRATSKALGSVLRFVVTLAGYSGTPAEEMPSEGPEPKGDPPPAADLIDDDRVKALLKAIQTTGYGFQRLCLTLGTLGADAPSIKRWDSIAKSLRALTLLQAAGLEADINAFAEQETSHE